MAWTWDAIKKQAVRVKDEAVGVSELARALAQGAAAEPLAGLAGMYGAATGGVDEGVRYIDKVRQKVGYQPESEEGRRNVEALARALAPVANALERGRTTLGDGALSATGSPALAAAAYTAPDAILAALGAKPAMSAGNAAVRRVGPVAKRMAARSQGPGMGSPAAQVGAIGHWKASPDALRMTKDDFIGSPKITKAGNAADLRPKALTTVQGAPDEPFMGRYSAKYSPDGAAVYDGDRVIASYNFGDTLVVDKPYRKGGIGSELVYEWRTRYPSPAAATTRTRASQALQEQVWERIQREMRYSE